MTQDDGRSPLCGSGCQASPSAADASSQSGIPNAATLRGAKYSPNLRSWLNGRDSLRQRAQVYRDKDAVLHIGELFEDGWFHGARLMRVLTVGRRATVFAYPPCAVGPFTLLPTFWAEYAEKGRCAIDPDHRMVFVGDETRWDVRGDLRSCQWCGECVQQIYRWTETETRKRERWINVASAMSAGTAETAEQAQGEARQRDGTEECRDAQGQPS